MNKGIFKKRIILMAIALKNRMKSFTEESEIINMIKKIMLLLFWMLENVMIQTMKHSIQHSARVKKKLMIGL